MVHERLHAWSVSELREAWPLLAPDDRREGFFLLSRGEALVGVVLFGTITGSMLPFLLRLLGFDPASASAPFIATLVDVSGLVIYFTVASLILRGTLL